MIRRGLDRSAHRVIYTLLFALVAMAVITLAVPLIREYSGENEQIIAIALLVVLLIEAIGERLHRFVEWLLHGQRHDAAVASWRLARQLESLDGDAAVPGLVAALADTLRLSHVSVVVHTGTEDVTLATVGDPVPTATQFAVRHAGQVLGVLSAARRAGPLNRQDERLLQATAAQLGLLLHAESLATQLQSARERLVSSREDERRRLRRELHDGVGPTLAGIALGLESAERLEARGPLADHDRERLRSLLHEVRGDVTAVVSDVRRVVDGLRPPLLDELGLVASLTQLARALGDRSGFAVRIEAPPSPPLPAAVEVAAYRIASEALTNVARHAAASQCAVVLRASGSSVLLRITDDGVGGARGTARGTGLSSMAERAEELGGSVTVTSGDTGSCVEAVLPLERVPARA